ncbi:hypothetical protein Back2_00450 [Nocardioides baekrokdamisoli]|uniref:Glycosyltransferase RgtA/B/C/D-like domain-containing protein n=1 Tax=Nocardioides baekrokdamisoli TaxID=1804624 RepID=A0A3G9IWX7_9ACTN|nr:hypothetical protein [Nocardioides baekrokdamisoli]BBH15758.1 hypothetical protein Back2_00450 [Nocardioides baekrokdamisoli]
MTTMQRRVGPTDVPNPRRLAGWIRPQRTLDVTAVDIALSAVLAALVLAVHDVAYMLRTPYWNDEAWVAISIKAPLHNVQGVIASTPIGWDLLLRLAPSSVPHSARMIPLAFSALVVLVAYWYARSLPWRSVTTARIAAVSAGVLALVSPAALVRNDLKQYTCDAFCVLLILALTARTERRPGWRSLSILAAAGVALFMFANPAALALVAGLASLGAAALIQRDWQRLRQIFAVGVTSALLVAFVYFEFYANGNIPGLRHYWTNWFLPVSQGPVATWHWFWGLAPAWFASVGVGPAVIAVPLLIASAIALARLGQPATGAFLPMLLLEIGCLSAMKQYPMFDERTMTFAAVAYAVTVAIGTAYWVSRIRASSGGVWLPVLLVGCVAIWHLRDGRQHSVPQQPTAADVASIKAGYQPGDAILANVDSTWAIGYYWGGPVRIVRSIHTQQKFRAYLVNGPTTMDLCPETVDGTAGLPGYPLCGTSASIAAALDRAALAAGPHHRVWFYNLEGRYPDTQATEAWAKAHHYALVRPDNTRGTMLALLYPKPRTTRN